MNLRRANTQQALGILRNENHATRQTAWSIARHGLWRAIVRMPFAARPCQHGQDHHGQEQTGRYPGSPGAAAKNKGANHDDQHKAAGNSSPNVGADMGVTMADVPGTGLLERRRGWRGPGDEVLLAIRRDYDCHWRPRRNLGIRRKQIGLAIRRSRPRPLLADFHRYICAGDGSIVGQLVDKDADVMARKHRDDVEHIPPEREAGRARC
ncbi:hypothetical protein GCM10019059_36430 [Camelimonas fluminis]|nr:hypothetical protein GCM10019059_36430 [Camelimonas fluminis]